jgi:hypothetical protein
VSLVLSPPLPVLAGVLVRRYGEELTALTYKIK